MLKYVIILLAAVAVLIACRNDRAELVPPASPAPSETGVVFDMAQVPYVTLSTYRFFQDDLADLAPNEGVLPYDVITPLFSDYALKQRWIWMPAGVQATYNGDHAVLDFPDGAVLIKHFYYDHVDPGDVRRHVETRMMIRKQGQWIFANYIWNVDQTEAHLDLGGQGVPMTWRDDQGETQSTTYRIPSASECFTCHKQDGLAMPIGTKPRQLARLMAYPDGPQDQLARWASMGYLATSYPSGIEVVARWDDEAAPLDDRVRAYLDMNCAHCHSDGKHCDYRPMRFAWHETADPVNLGLCVEPEEALPNNPELVYIVAPGNTYRSMMLHRVNATDQAVRMPLLGRTLVHAEGAQLLEDWINSLTETCN